MIVVDCIRIVVDSFIYVVIYTMWVSVIVSIHVITNHKSAISTSITFNKLIVAFVLDKITIIVNVISVIMTTTLIMMCCSVI